MLASPRKGVALGAQRSLRDRARQWPRSARGRAASFFIVFRRWRCAERHREHTHISSRRRRDSQREHGGISERHSIRVSKNVITTICSVDTPRKTAARLRRPALAKPRAASNTPPPLCIRSHVWRGTEDCPRHIQRSGAHRQSVGLSQPRQRRAHRTRRALCPRKPSSSPKQQPAPGHRAARAREHAELEAPPTRLQDTAADQRTQ